MLTDNWSFHAPKSGRAEIKRGGLNLFSPDQTKDINIHQNIPSFVQGSILKLSADMKCENIVPGEKSWNRARLLLVQQTGQKARWDLPHTVVSFTGTGEWGSYYKFFTIDPETKKIRVTAQLSRCTGSFWLENIHLFPVTQTKAFTWVKTSVLTLWCIFSIFLLGSCFLNGKKKVALRVMLILAFITIIIGTTMPADIKAQVSNGVQSQIHAIPWDLSKVGHFCFFALFGIVLSLLLNLESVIPVMVNILLLAGGTEIAQLFIDGRSPLLLDFFIDAAGGLSGVILIKLSGMKKSKPGLEKEKNII